MSDTFKRTNDGQKKKAIIGDPMGGPYNKKARVRKKGPKIDGGDNQKHSTLNLNGTTYNGIDNAYVFLLFLLELQQQKTHKKQKRKIL